MNGMGMAFSLLAFLFANGPAFAVELGRFLAGSTGYARVFDPSRRLLEKGDVDPLIRPFRDPCFTSEWVDVTLAGGRRDVAGVCRRTLAFAFVRAGGQDVEAPVHEFFPGLGKMPLARGRPLRWAVLDDQALRVHSFVVPEDGRFEPESYLRASDGDGLRLLFERIEDGVVVRRIEGRAILAE